MNLVPRIKQFEPGRESIWANECPITADGMLLDLWHDAIDDTFNCIDQLSSARRSSAEYTDRDLDDAEKHLRKALAHIADIRQYIATVPSNFGSFERKIIQIHTGGSSGDQSSDTPCGQVYIPSSFGNGTICDLPDEYFDYSEMTKLDRRIQNGVLLALVFLVLGFVTASLWTAAYQLGELQNAAIRVTGFEGDSGK